MILLPGWRKELNFTLIKFIVFIIMNANSIAAAGNGRIPLIKFLGNRIASAQNPKVQHSKVQYPKVRVADTPDKTFLMMKQPFIQLPNRFRRIPLDEIEIEIIRVLH